MARQRKSDIDRVLLDTKESIKDIRYIICIGKDDLQVVLKRGYPLPETKEPDTGKPLQV